MDTAQAATMAAYNRWMNRRLYGVCADIPEAERRADRGAFFGSIHGTLNHLLLADRIWLGRFLDEPFAAERLDQELYRDFDALRAAREQADGEIVAWARSLTDAALAGTLHYRSLADPQPRTCAMWLAVAHFFNHQTHHRGQLTALLSQLGRDYGVTDLIRLPEAVDPEGT